MATKKFCDRCECDITKVEIDRVIKVSEGNLAYDRREYDLCVQCINNFKNVWILNATGV